MVKVYSPIHCIVPWRIIRSERKEIINKFNINNKIWKKFLKLYARKKSIYNVTVSLWRHAPGHNYHCATISPSLPASVPSRNQETVPLSHHHTLPPATPSHCASCHQHAVTVSPLDLVHHRTTVPPGAPPCDLVRLHVTVTPCRRLTDTTHRHTYVHPRTWHLSIIPPDTVWRNFTIWSVAKNSNDYFTMFKK